MRAFEQGNIPGSVKLKNWINRTIDVGPSEEIEKNGISEEFRKQAENCLPGANGVILSESTLGTDFRTGFPVIYEEQSTPETKITREIK